jgi:sterol 14alpha-demethylase
MQLKAIFAVLLPRFTFELTQPHDTYRNDHSKMVVQLAQPCAARMTPRRLWTSGHAWRAPASTDVVES